MTFRHRLVIPSAYLTIGMCGVYLSMFQISLLQISQRFALDSLMMGVLVAVQYMGLCITPLFLGSMSERLGKRGVMTISIPLMIAGTLMVSLSNSLAFFLIGIFVIGAGFSVTEGTMSATLGAEFPEKSKLHLGVSQAIFSLGAVLSPFASEAIFRTGRTYQDTFLYVSLIFMGLYALFFFTKHQNDIRGSADYGIAAAARLFTKKTFVLLAVGIFLCVGIEEIVAFFSDSYYELTLQSPQFSALALGLFWACMIPSRLLLGVVRLSHKAIVFICMGCIIASSTVIAAAPDITVKLAAYAVLGFGCGPTWPLILDIVAKRYPQNVGLGINVMMSMSGLGGALTPLAVGAIVVGADFTPVFITAALCAVGIAVSFALAVRNSRKKQPQKKP